MKNKFLEKIYSRRSIREFTEQKISPSILSSIVKAGLHAPSAKDTQPWHILVLRNKNKDLVAGWMKENKHNRETKPRNSWDSTACSIEIIKRAQVLLVLFNKGTFLKNRKYLSKIIVDSVETGAIYTYGIEILGIGACMQNILLAAHVLGLGAVALGDLYPAEPMIQKKFKIKYDLVIGIALGYPAYKAGKRKIDLKKNVVNLKKDN
jgi:nitroreductase